MANEFHTKGFTLFELLIVMFLIGIIFAIAIPGITVSKKEAFPVILKNIFRSASVQAVVSGSEVTVGFKEDGIHLSDKIYSYPDKITPDQDFDLLFSRFGFVVPGKLLFYKGTEKLIIRAGLFGITVE